MEFNVAANVIFSSITTLSPHCSLSQCHASVAATTTALHDACQSLMQSQTSLAAYLQDITTHMQPFTEFDTLAHKVWIIH